MISVIIFIHLDVSLALLRVHCCILNLLFFPLSQCSRQLTWVRAAVCLTLREEKRRKSPAWCSTLTPVSSVSVHAFINSCTPAGLHSVLPVSMHTLPRITLATTVVLICALAPSQILAVWVIVRSSSREEDLFTDMLIEKRFLPCFQGKKSSRNVYELVIRIFPDGTFLVETVNPQAFQPLFSCFPPPQATHSWGEVSWSRWRITDPTRLLEFTWGLKPGANQQRNVHCSVREGVGQYLSTPPLSFSLLLSLCTVRGAEGGCWEVRVKRSSSSASLQ